MKSTFISDVSDGKYVIRRQMFVPIILKNVSEWHNNRTQKLNYATNSKSFTFEGVHVVPCSMTMVVQFSTQSWK